MNNILVKIEPAGLVEEKPHYVSRYDKKEEITSENVKKPQLIKEVTSEENEPSTSEIFEEEDETDLHVCCYCGENQSLKEMTSTPVNHEEYMKWYRILGEKFHENATLSKPSLICRRHFDDEFGASSMVDASYKNTANKTKPCAYLKCRYCRKRKLRKQLTLVPKDKPIFADWVDILGEEFAENCRNSNFCYICRTHFDIKWKWSRPRCCLPVADLGKNVENSSTSKTSITMYHCIFCGEHMRYGDLTQVPQDPFILKSWGDVLGEEFYRIATMRKMNFICRSHFNVKWNNTRPHGILPYVKVDHPKDTSSNEEPITLEEDDENAEIPLICVFCEQWKTRTELRAVTSHPVTIERWIKILGDDFYKRARAKRRAFICKSHFNDEEIRKRYQESVKKEVDVQVKSEEPDTYENIDEDLLKCCYCEDQKIIEDMALVPRDKQGLTRWMNILGVEFYQNVMKNKHSYICRTHFNEQWKSEKTPKNVLPVIRIEGLEEEQTPPNVFNDRVEIHDVRTKDLVKKNLGSHFPSGMSTVIKEEEKEAIPVQYESPVPKRIKIEVKEEPIY